MTGLLIVLSLALGVVAKVVWDREKERRRLWRQFETTSTIRVGRPNNGPVLIHRRPLLRAAREQFGIRCFACDFDEQDLPHDEECPKRKWRPY